MKPIKKSVKLRNLDLTVKWHGKVRRKKCTRLENSTLLNTIRKHTHCRIKMRHTFAEHSASLHPTLPHASRVRINNRCLQFLLVGENTSSLFNGQLTSVFGCIRVLNGKRDFLYAVVPRVLGALLQTGHFLSRVDVDLWNRWIILNHQHTQREPNGQCHCLHVSICLMTLRFIISKPKVPT